MTTAALRRRPPVELAGFAALTVMWLAQVSIPLTDDHRVATNVVVGALALAVVCFGAVRWPDRAVAALAVVAAFGLAVEVVGTRTGLPFGDYRYTGHLRPTVAGVPIAVVLAWFGMGLPAWAVARRLATRTWAAIVIGAVALTGWDLFLDPQMVGEGWWAFDGGGAYRDVPLSNFAGWLVAAGVVMTMLSALLPDADASTPLVATYALMSAMEAMGFVLFFGDPLVGVIGALATFPLAFLALRRRG